MKHYNYFRDYDPGIGRYLESDPIGLKGGPNTFSYVRSNALSRIDRLGLLIGFAGCDSSQQSDLGHAEEQLKNFFNSHCAGCNDPGGRCIDCNLAHDVVKKIETNYVSCSAFNMPLLGGGGRLADASAPGSSMMVYPLFFGYKGPVRCMASTLFHEALHSLGMLHGGSGSSGYDPGDSIYQMEERCGLAGLCGGK